MKALALHFFLSAKAGKNQRLKNPALKTKGVQKRPNKILTMKRDRCASFGISFKKYFALFLTSLRL
jgi:hypothetical protein